MFLLAAPLGQGWKDKVRLPGSARPQIIPNPPPYFKHKPSTALQPKIRQRCDPARGKELKEMGDVADG